MSRTLLRRWRERGGRAVRIVLPFDDVMAFALALLSVSPAELEALGWTFAERKRLLDHFVDAARSAQGTPPEALSSLPIEVAIPQRDVDRLQRFARRELPKAASDAAMLDRVLRALDGASNRRPA